MDVYDSAAIQSRAAFPWAPPPFAASGPGLQKVKNFFTARMANRPGDSRRYMSRNATTVMKMNSVCGYS
jgi:hypothetical protein